MTVYGHPIGESLQNRQTNQDQGLPSRLVGIGEYHKCHVLEYERSPNLDKLPQYCVLHKITNLCMYDMLVALILERVPITSFGGNRIIHFCGASSRKSMHIRKPECSLAIFWSC